MHSIWKERERGGVDTAAVLPIVRLFLSLFIIGISLSLVDSLSVPILDLPNPPGSRDGFPSGWTARLQHLSRGTHRRSFGAFVEASREKERDLRYHRRGSAQPEAPHYSATLASRAVIAVLFPHSRPFVSLLLPYTPFYTAYMRHSQFNDEIRYSTVGSGARPVPSTLCDAYTYVEMLMLCDCA